MEVVRLNKNLVGYYCLHSTTSLLYCKYTLVDADCCSSPHVVVCNAERVKKALVTVLNLNKQKHLDIPNSFKACMFVHARAGVLPCSVKKIFRFMVWFGLFGFWFSFLGTRFVRMIEFCACVVQAIQVVFFS